MKLISFYIILTILFLYPVLLLSNTYRTIRIEKGDTLWGISEKLYNDPLKWYILSEINNISNPNKIMPATEIRVPVDMDSYVRERVERRMTAQESIITDMNDIQATQETPGEIVSLSDLKIELPTLRQLREEDLTTISPHRALESPYTEKFALINFIRGNVSFKHSVQNIWVSLFQSGIPFGKNDMLATEENSIAMISFEDGSYIRIMPNTIIKVIKSHFDTIENKLNTEIQIMEGSIEAHIRTAAPVKTAFSFRNEDITARGIGKYNINVNKDGDLIAELFEGNLNVSGRDRNVNLSENSGIYVDAGSPPLRAVPLLHTPKQVSPPDKVFARTSVPRFEWTKIENAIKYKIQIAKDPIFNLMVLEDNFISENEFIPRALIDGKYYWRIAAVDANGISSNWSDIRVFEIDTLPPRLIVTSPLENEIIRERRVTITAITEPSQPVTINQFTHFPDKKGRIEVEKQLNKGTNVVMFKSRDRAGNETILYRTFHLDPYKETEIVDGNIFSTTGEWAVNVFNAKGQIILNDRFYDINFGQFQQDLTFRNGPNHLILTLDDIGYKDIVFRYAKNPPVIRQIRISPLLKDNKAYLNVFVKAEETDAPLAETAELVIEEFANISNRYPVMLYYSKTINEYQGVVAVHPNVLKRELSIGSIKVSDIIGNETYKTSGSFDRPHEVSDFWTRARSQYSAFKIRRGIPVFLLSAAGLLLML